MKAAENGRNSLGDILESSTRPLGVAQVILVFRRFVLARLLEITLELIVNISRVIGRVVVVAVSVAFLTGGISRHRDEGRVLGNEVVRILISRGYCATYQDCISKKVLFVDHDEVALEIYGIDNRAILGAIFEMIVSEGNELTGGAPITVKVFDEAKDKYVGLASFFKAPTITMEINK